MVKTQVQIPDHLYREAKRLAREREMSLAEIMRQGLEYMVRVYPPRQSSGEWSPPPPRHLGRFLAPPEAWRELSNIPMTGGEDG